MQLIVVDAEVVRDLMHERRVDLVAQLLFRRTLGKVWLSVQHDAIREFPHAIAAAFGEGETVVETEKVEGAVFGAVLHDEDDILQVRDHLVGEPIQFVDDHCLESLGVDIQRGDNEVDAHGDTGSELVESLTAFFVDERLEEVTQRRLAGAEAVARVERRIPRDILVRAQGHSIEALSCCFVDGGVEESCAVSTSLVVWMDGELLEVGGPFRRDDVHESDGGSIGFLGAHEEEARMLGAFIAGRSTPSDIAEERVEALVCRALYFSELKKIPRGRRPEVGSHIFDATQRRGALDRRPREAGGLVYSMTSGGVLVVRRRVYSTSEMRKMMNPAPISR